MSLFDAIFSRNPRRSVDDFHTMVREKFEPELFKSKQWVRPNDFQIGIDGHVIQLLVPPRISTQAEFEDWRHTESLKWANTVRRRQAAAVAAAIPEGKFDEITDAEIIMEAIKRGYACQKVPEIKS